MFPNTFEGDLQAAETPMDTVSCPPKRLQTARPDTPTLMTNR